MPGAGGVAAEADEAAAVFAKGFAKFGKSGDASAFAVSADFFSVKNFEAVLTWARARAPTLVPAIQLGLATAKARDPAARGEAAREMAELTSRTPRVDLPVRVAAAIRLAALQREAGKSAEGFAVLRQLADELDHAQPVGQPARPAEFWQLWAEMLAVMESENKTGERSGDIRLRIRQIETIDPKLGDGEWAVKIRTIEKGLK
jgi:hypothetical protein